MCVCIADVVSVLHYVVVCGVVYLLDVGSGVVEVLLPSGYSG